MNEAARREDRVHWTTPGLTEVRLVLEVDGVNDGLLSVVECTGKWKGSPIKVTVPFHSLPKSAMRSAIVDHAKREGVYAKDLGILENIEVY